MKLELIFISIFLICCSDEKVILISNIDTKAQLSFDFINNELNDRYKENLFLKNDSGVSIVVDSVRLGIEKDNKERHGIGIFLSNSREIILPDPSQFVIYNDGNMFLVNEEYLKVILAHELAHSVGIEHSKLIRLMNEVPSVDCIDKVAECLLEAIGK